MAAAVGPYVIGSNSVESGSLNSHLRGQRFFHLNPTVVTLQKQPSNDVLWKRCSENMPQIYRRSLMPKCDFNKVTKQLY